MAPRTRQACCLNQTPSGLNNTSLGDSTHASIVDQVGVEAQPAVNPTNPQNNANSTSNTATLDINHTLIKTRKTYLYLPRW